MRVVNAPQQSFLFYDIFSTIDQLPNYIQENLSSSRKDEIESSKLPRRRTAFTEQQLAHLEHAFQKCHYPKIDTRMKLALETQLSETRIQVWFKNRRAKYRKKLRNMADPGAATNSIVPKFNAVITWKPNGMLAFVMPFRECKIFQQTLNRATVHIGH